MKTMYRKKTMLLLATLISLAACCPENGRHYEENQEITIPREVLMDKIKGGWAGQTIGVTYGGPTEFNYQSTIIPDFIPIKYDPGCVKWWFEHSPGLYDDIYMDLTFVDIIEKKGLDAPAEEFAQAFAHADYPLWHANQSARYNILNGILPPASGYWKNNPHADDIDFQIEADFAGLMAPGMPNACVGICDKVGHMMNYGDGWYGGVYVAALYALAYIYDDVRTVVEEALELIPRESKYHQCIRDILDWHDEFPDDWKQTWFECEQKWGEDIGCTDGVYRLFNIDALINSAYVVIGLLYGEGDFFRSMDIATRCGQDSDCNPATVAGVLGTMYGYSSIEDRWLDNIKEVEDIDFKYTDISLNDVYDLSCKHALEMVRRNGGKVTGDAVTIVYHRPVPVPFEESFPDHRPLEKISLEHWLQAPLQVAYTCKGFNFSYWLDTADQNYVAQVEVTLDGQPEGVIPLPKNLLTRKNELFSRYDLDYKKHEIGFRWLNPEPGVNLIVSNLILYGPVSEN